MTDTTYLTDHQATERLKVSRATLYRAAQDYNFPKPIRLTSESLGWKRSDIEKWEARRGLNNG